MRLTHESLDAQPLSWSSPPPQTPKEESQPRDDGESRRSNVREIWPLMALWVFMAVFSILYSLYVYKSLISTDPSIGSLLPSASDTNLVVSILSQVLANLVDFLLMGVFDVLRWQLAARFSGVSATTFFQLSSSTQWISVFFLTITKFSGAGIGLVRLLLPVFGLYFGSILKYRAEFVYYFKETAAKTPVFAGSGLPMDESLLALIPASYAGMFFMSWIASLLDVPKYAVPMSIHGCDENCTSAFLPGGVETVRKLAPYLNMTLMEGGAFRNSETIQIENAPGILLRYDLLPPSFDFDRATECYTYGEHLNDTLQVCIKAVNGSLAAAWQACPNILYQTSSCVTNTTWLNNPLPKKILVTRYKQFATTAYSGLDFTILNTKPTSDPVHEPLNVTTYLALFDKLFEPPFLSTTDPSSSSNQTQQPTQSDINNQHVTSALVYAVTWLIRLYDDVFPDDTHSPLAHLRNFIAIPQQFMVTCMQFANYSLPADFVAANPEWEGAFALPDDMQTAAVKGKSTTRLLALGWVVWVYIASAAVVVIGVGAVVVGMLVRKEGVPASSGFVEVDLAARFQDDNTVDVDNTEGERDRDGNRSGNYGGLRVIRDLGRAKGAKVAMSSSFGVARELRRRRIRVVSLSSSNSRRDHTRNELFAFREERRLDNHGENGGRPDMLQSTNSVTGERRRPSFRNKVGWLSWVEQSRLEI